MSDDVFPLLDPIAGPIVCPPWCSRLHNDGRDNVEDGITHISEPVIWDMPVNRPFPKMQFDLVSYERPQGRTPVLEVSAVGETARCRSRSTPAMPLSWTG